MDGPPSPSRCVRQSLVLILGEMDRSVNSPNCEIFVQVPTTQQARYPRADGGKRPGRPRAGRRSPFRRRHADEPRPPKVARPLLCALENHAPVRWVPALMWVLNPSGRGIIHTAAGSVPRS
jgi:hypothetical protein